MILECSVAIEEELYPITISDELPALLDAKASGRAILGVCGENLRNGPCPCSYLVEAVEQADEQLLERVVRRHLGLPWVICESSQLILREWKLSDAKLLQTCSELSGEERIFAEEGPMSAYIQEQYGYYEYGIWAVVKKHGGELIGMAGVGTISLSDSETGMEIGYHIFHPYRRQGYGREAVESILSYVKQEVLTDKIYAKIDASNEASICLAESLGFRIIRTDNESGQCSCLYEWYCS